jgi:hypothetical protein
LFKKVVKFLVLIVLGVVVLAGLSVIYKDYKHKEYLASLPTLPVVYKKRASILGRGDVMVLMSRHSEDLFVQATFKNQQKQKTISMLMKPNSRHPIGWAEGWRLEKGDALKISSKGFKPAYYYHKHSLEKIDPELVCGVASISGFAVLCSLIES